MRCHDTYVFAGGKPQGQRNTASSYRFSVGRKADAEREISKKSVPRGLFRFPDCVGAFKSRYRRQPEKPFTRVARSIDHFASRLAGASTWLRSNIPSGKLGSDLAKRNSIFGNGSLSEAMDTWSTPLITEAFPLLIFSVPFPRRKSVPKPCLP